jgi:hypothetical protein
MNIPDLLGVEVLTPDGRGSILSLHTKKVIIRLNKIGANQVMKGSKREEMNYSYDYNEVEIIKGQHCYDESRLKFQYPEFPI